MNENSKTSKTRRAENITAMKPFSGAVVLPDTKPTERLTTNRKTQTKEPNRHKDSLSELRQLFHLNLFRGYMFGIYFCSF